MHTQYNQRHTPIHAKNLLVYFVYLLIPIEKR